jgi:hypothetical protein
MSISADIWQYLILGMLLRRYHIDYNEKLGICTVVFGPEMDDLGQWSCIFTIENWEIASASLVLLTTPPGKLNVEFCQDTKIIHVSMALAL